MGILSEKDFIKRVRTLDEISFKPGDRNNPELMDSHDLKYLKSGEFRANLHIHTEHSDGIISVENLLTKCAETPNVMIAITDHDNIDGCKKAQKLCPDNINLVLGLELSTVAINFPKQQKPMPIHILAYGIDPKDSRLNEFLDLKRDLKLQLAKDTICELNKALPEYNFNIEDAAKCHPMILKGQDEVAHPLKKYTCSKILLDHYFPNANFSYEQPFFKHKYLFGNDSFIINYKRALELYVGCSLPLIPDEIIEKVQIAKEIYTKSHPKIGKMHDAFTSFEDGVEFINSLDCGVMSIAHPARYRAYTPEFYTYLFSNFKKHGKEKALFFEKYYQSYEGKYFLEWCPIINRTAENFGLQATGGLDSHGNCITYRSPHY